MYLDSAREILHEIPVPGAVKQFLQKSERSSVISCMKHV